MSVPNIFSVAIISLLFFIIFGIIGTNYNKGALYECQQIKFQMLSLEHKWDCLNSGGEWTNSQWNFDRLSESLFSMFTMSTTVGWAQFMYQGIDIVKVDFQPQRNYQTAKGLFYVFFIIVGNFFILNLFVGVVISNYNREKEKLGKDFMLSKGQKKWLETKLMLIKTKPKVLKLEPKNKILKFAYKVAISVKLEYFIYACILLNTIVLSFTWYDEPEGVTLATEIINGIFTIVFTLECIIKILGL